MCALLKTTGRNNGKFQGNKQITLRGKKNKMMKSKKRKNQTMDSTGDKRKYKGKELARSM
jgi:hypothetical protein